jgi:5-methylcytosine-specific restriction enzyme subunit McrC
MYHMVQSQRFEQSSDVAVNRLIKEALLFVLQRIRRDSPDSRTLITRANAAYFDLPGVIGGPRPSDYETCKRLLHERTLPASRSYYFRSLEIALLILSNRGIALQEPGDDVLLETFIINFEDLFEEYLRRVLQRMAFGTLLVQDGNNEGKKALFEDKLEPPAQPDIVFSWKPTGRTVIAEVKYENKPNRDDYNQAITYALCYGMNHAVLVHQSKPGGAKGLKLTGTIRGIRIETYAFDLGADDLDAEEKAFCDCMFALGRPPHVTGEAALRHTRRRSPETVLCASGRPLPPSARTLSGQGADNKVGELRQIL